MEKLSVVDPEEWARAIAASNAMPLQPGEASWQAMHCGHGMRRAEQIEAAYIPPGMRPAPELKESDDPVDNRGDIQ